jgi:hypothetical protein
MFKASFRSLGLFDFSTNHSLAFLLQFLRVLSHGSTIFTPHKTFAHCIKFKTLCNMPTIILGIVSTATILGIDFVICRQQYLVSYTNGWCVCSEVYNVTWQTCCTTTILCIGFVIWRQQYLVSYTNGWCVCSEVDNVTWQTCCTTATILGIVYKWICVCSEVDNVASQGQGGKGWRFA